MQTNWYKKASINPWSIFENAEYNRELGIYSSVTVNKYSLSDFVTDITSINVGVSSLYAPIIGGENYLSITIWVPYNTAPSENEVKLILSSYAATIINSICSLGESMVDDGNSSIKGMDVVLGHHIDCTMQIAFKGEIILSYEH
jgi:hypothetical protein